MGFCEHCEGQRFDRARVLRALRRAHRNVRQERDGRRAADAIAAAIKIVRGMDVPHLEPVEEEVIH